MKKGFLLGLIFFLSSTSFVQAQNTYAVLDWKSHSTLYNAIKRELHDQYVSRDSLLNKAFETKTLDKYREQSRKRYLELLGDFPSSSDLNVKITGTIKQDGYKIQKVVYESFPHHHVTANLYIPSGEGPFPAVLFLCGHEATAKATLTYQQTAIRFAQNGFVVLVIDPISQGERYQLTSPTGKPLTRGGTTEHTLLSSGSNLVGTNTVAYELWDNERGLDYLSSLPMVDTTRLGCLGNSGGGTQTAYFIPYDSRIKVAAVASYVTRRERTLLLIGPQDGCQWLPKESKSMLDISDYLTMFAPKPMLILAGRYGFVDYGGTEDVYRELKDFYTQLGSPEKIKLFAYDDGHGIQKPKQIAAVKWFKRWLKKEPSSIVRKVPHTLTEQQLNVTQTGQVNTAFPEEVTIPDRNLSLADKWKEKRQVLLKKSTKKEYRAMLKKVLHLKEYSSTVNVQNMGAFKQSGYDFKKLILRREGQPPLPVYFASASASSTNEKLFIILNEEGKKKFMQKKDSLIKAYAQKGYALLLADLRGMGETSDYPDKNNKKYYNEEYRNAMLSLFIGKPLPGQRVEDIFTLLDYSQSKLDLQQPDIIINASGRAAEATLFAAALDKRISKIQLSETVTSFYELLKNPTMKNQYSYVVPDALKYFDLPDIVQFVGKKKVEYEK